LHDPQKAAFYAGYHGDYRTLDLKFTNEAMAARVPDISGYDPTALRRYCEFINWSQGLDPDEATAYLNFKQHNPLFSMLRCRYVFVEKDGVTNIAEVGSGLPHLLLLDEYSVQAGRDAICARMSRKGFDPRREVILESEPDPRPQRGAAEGRVRLVNSSSDWLEIEADVPRPMILLVTDSYSKGWKAYPLSGSGAQQKYTVQPANYVLRAIALQAGHHHLRLEYLPRSFVIGKWISIVALVLYASLLVCLVVAARSKEPSHLPL
jgi:hypothetical protein